MASFMNSAGDGGMFPEINSSYKRNSQNEIGMPVKKLMKQQRMDMITTNPQNMMGNSYLRDKFKLPDPNKGKKVARQIGGPNNLVNSKPVGKTSRPKRILPKHVRDDPAADGPKITEDDLQDGMMSLLNRGMIPKGVDVTPAFERGKAPFEFGAAKIHNAADKKAIVAKKTPSIGYKKPGTAEHDERGPATFITAEEGFENTYLNNIHKSDDNLFAHEQYGREENKREELHNVQPEAPLSPDLQDDQLQLKEQEEEDFQFNTQDQNINDGEGLYSMYQISIKGGKVVESSPEYMSFKRANITKWGAISLVLYLLEKMLTLYHVPYASINCHKLLQLAEEELTRPNHEELLDCCINRPQVEEIINNPYKKFKGPSGPDLAAICIQKNWRRFKAYTAFTLLKYSMSKATIIQRRWRLFQLMKNTKAKIKQFNEESINEWKIMMKEFRRRWPDVKKKRRVEIHINSFSFSEQKRLSMEKFQQRENCQISRIFSVKDPKVDVIYVAPFTLTNEVYEYYKKILELGELEKPENRFHIVVPENYVKFKETMSLTQTLIYSPKAIKRIKTLIEERQAYIVPGISTNEDVKLSITLGIPIMCGDPSKVSLYSTKSGAKRIFQQADVPSPISAYDIYDRREFEVSLWKLIAHNLYVNTWIFKIDDEFNGRGHAALNVDSIKTVIELRKRKFEITDNIIENKLVEVISKLLPKKVKIAMPSLYRSWDEYIEAFWHVGGVIEAAPSCSPKQVVSPSVSFFVAPDGEIDLIGSFDRFSAKEFINAGCFFPQTSLPNINLMTLCKSLGDILYEKGVIGHVTVDLVAFPDPTNPKAHPLFWAVDINWSLSDYAAACFHFDLLMEGRIDKFTGQYFVEVQRDPDELIDAEAAHEAKDKTNKNEFFEPRSFMFCKYLHHPGLATIQFNTFFHMCRLESVSYDMEKRTGSTFCLYDCLQGGVIGLITVGEHRKVTVNYMVEALNFIQNQAGVIPSKAISEDSSRVDEINVGDVFSRVVSLVSYFKKGGYKASNYYNKMHYF